jgi:hypothetical protein
LMRPLALYKDRPGTSSSGGSSSAGNSAPGTPVAGAAAGGGGYAAPGFSRFRAGGGGDYAQMSAANTPSAVQGNPYFGAGRPGGVDPLPSAPPLPVSSAVGGYPQQSYPPLQQPQQYGDYPQQQYYEYPPQQQQVKSPAFMPAPTTSPQQQQQQQQQQLPGPALAGAGPSFDLLGSPVGSGNFGNFTYTPPATASPGITGLTPVVPAAGAGVSSSPSSGGGRSPGMRRTGSAGGMRPSSPLGEKSREVRGAVPSYTDGRVSGAPGTAGQSPRQPAQPPW